LAKILSEITKTSVEDKTDRVDSVLQSVDTDGNKASKLNGPIVKNRF